MDDQRSEDQRVDSARVEAIAKDYMKWAKPELCRALAVRVNELQCLRAACRHAEAVLSIVEPRSDKAEYLRTLAELRSALGYAK